MIHFVFIINGSNRTRLRGIRNVSVVKFEEGELYKTIYGETRGRLYLDFESGNYTTALDSLLKWLEIESQDVPFDDNTVEFIPNTLWFQTKFEKTQFLDLLDQSRYHPSINHKRILIRDELYDAEELRLNYKQKQFKTKILKTPMNRARNEAELLSQILLDRKCQ